MCLSYSRRAAQQQTSVNVREAVGPAFRHLVGASEARPKTVIGLATASRIEGAVDVPAGNAGFLHDRLTEIAADKGLSLEQMAIAWALRQSVVTTVLVGARSAAPVEEHVRRRRGHLQ